MTANTSKIPIERIETTIENLNEIPEPAELSKINIAYKTIHQIQAAISKPNSSETIPAAYPALK